MCGEVRQSLSPGQVAAKGTEALKDKAPGPHDFAEQSPRPALMIFVCHSPVPYSTGSDSIAVLLPIEKSHQCARFQEQPQILRRSL